MKMGTARWCITPPMPLRLCGYASRRGMFTSIEEDIFLRVQLHGDGESIIAFLYADILWWGTDFVETLRPLIHEELGIPPEQVFFVASHNHSGPPTGSRFTPTLETVHTGYIAFLKQAVLDGLRRAHENMEDVTAELCKGESALNVFRRVQGADGVEMRPNYHVPADSHLTVLAFRRADGSLKGSMIHYACHANLSGDNTVQPDYPGVLLRLMDEAYPGSVPLFLQGCTGDLRPNSVLGDRFCSVHYTEVCQFASRLFDACIRLLEEGGTSVVPELRVRRTEVRLPFENRLSLEELHKIVNKGEGIQCEWAQKVMEHSEETAGRMEISRIRYGEALSLYTFNAEMSQYYAAFARELEPGSLSVAYCNGMIGYISTAQQIREGGYEPKESSLFFALPGTYPETIEGIIQEAMRSLRSEEDNRIGKERSIHADRDTSAPAACTKL